MAIFLLLTVVALSFKDEDPVASSVKFSFVQTVLHLPLFLWITIPNYILPYFCGQIFRILDMIFFHPFKLNPYFSEEPVCI